MSDASAWAQWVAQAVAETVRSRFCHPTATYRIQFGHGQMTFRDAAGIVPYLDQLGISHLYASPYLKARGKPAWLCHRRLRETESGVGRRARLSNDGGSLAQPCDGPDSGCRAESYDATPAENPWWNDVLESGPASPHAAYFDIDSHRSKRNCGTKSSCRSWEISTGKSSNPANCKWNTAKARCSAVHPVASAA